ncbi:hypothetical protein ABK040_015979 [Willaertia magna]
MQSYFTNSLHNNKLFFLTCFLLLILLLSVTHKIHANGSIVNREKKKNVNKLEQYEFNIDLNQQPIPFEHFWKKSVGSGHATLCLRTDWRKQLKLAKEELGFEGIRFHGILSDDMSVILQDRHNSSKLVYSFYNVDNCFDFLVNELDFKPIIELGFMPSLIAKNPNQTVFHYKGGVSPPKNYNLWSDLIFNFVQHLVDRYSLQKVKEWYFEVWNEPNLKDFFWWGTQEEYFELYKSTVLAIKKISKDLKVGGPATAGNDWLKEMITYCKQNNLPIDFIATHNYPYDVYNRNVLVDGAIDARKTIGNNIPLFYTEWNAGIDLQGHGVYLTQDSEYPAAFVIPTLFKVNSIVDVFSFWTFTDIFEEQGQYPEVFQEAFGMITVYNIKKPVWRAFELIGKSGNLLYHSSSNLNKSKRNYKIDGKIVDNNNATVEVFTTLNKERKELMIFISNFQVPSQPIYYNETLLTLNVLLNNNNDNNINSLQNCKVTIIDRNHSNAYTEWLNIGKPTYPTSNELNRLKRASELFNREIYSNSNVKGKEIFKLTITIPSLNVITCEIV